MMETMIEYHGVGLAAPQVHEGLRLFVACIDPMTDAPARSQRRPIAIVNPEITAVGGEMVEDWEGCLSIPDIRGRVPRARESAARPRSAGRAVRDATLEDFPARVIQHETRPPRRRPVLRPHEARVRRDRAIPKD